MTGERSPHRAARAVLASGLLLGVGYGVYEVARNPARLGIDYRVYHVAAEAVLAGRQFYGITPDGLPSLFHYVYPPLTVLAFLPLALIDGWPAGFVVHTTLTTACGVGVGWLTVDYLADAGVVLGRLDELLIYGFAAGSVHAMPSLVFGQVNHQLALFVTLGFVALARDRQSLGGGALGAAAFLKLFPTLLGLWLVVRRRWRAVAAATAIGTGCSLAGLLLFGPGTTRRYVETAVLPRSAPDAFAGGLSPTATYVTLRRPISVALPTVDPGLYGPLAALVFAPVLAVCYRNTGRSRVDWLIGVWATLSFVVLVFPSFPIYLILLTFPLVALLYLLPAGRPRQVFVAGALVTNLSIRYDELREAAAVLDLPAGSVAALRPVFTVATPPLIGLLVACAGLVAWKRKQ